MEIKKIYPLSPLQSGMLFHFIEDRKSHAYFIQTVFELIGNLDIDILNKSYNKLIERYDVLRTLFIYENVEKPIQVVVKERSTEVTFVDFSKLGEKEKYNELDKYCYENRNKGFDLSKDILFHITVIHRGRDSFWIILEFHHIIMDGWCLGIILQELFKIYNSINNSTKLNLPSIVPYSNFIDWIGKQGKKVGLDFWSRYLVNYEQVIGLPILANTDTREKLNYNEIDIVLDDKFSSGIEKIAKENNVTTNTLFQSLWGVLLQKYNNTDDVVFGVVVSGRPSEVLGIENMVGLCINTVPCRVKSKKDQSFLDLLLENQAKNNEAKAYEYMQLSEIQSCSKIKGGLIDHILTYENYPIDIEYLNENDSNIDFRIEEIQLFEQTNYKFSIKIIPRSNFIIVFSFDTRFYNYDFIENITFQFNGLVKQIIDNMNCKIVEIDLLSEIEKKRLLYEFNDTKTDYLDQRTIQQLIEDQILINPESIAVYEGEKKLKYSELGDKSDCLSRLLIESGIKKGDIIPILLERSIDTIIAIFAILKSGGVFLNLEVKSPKGHLQYILEDIGNDIVLSKKELWNNFNLRGRVICVENLLDNRKPDLKQSNNTDFSDGAYVIYTSGTTGNPKGTLITQKGLVNYIRWANNKYIQGEKVDFPLFTSLAFDLTITSVFAPLISGNGIVVYNEEYENEMLIEKVLDDNKVGVIKLTPSHLKVLKERDDAKLNLKKLKLKRLIVGGEQLMVELANEIFNKYSGQVEIYNEYGPTEVTVGCTICKFDKERDNKISVPIGRPIANTNVYVLDNNLKLLPVGVSGELYISGAGIATGYLGLSNLTSEKFIPHPFKEGERLYKTGDLARWLPDGNIEFLGRLDDQVKIRGFRIELGEIESALLKHENIKESVVITFGENGDKYLCAYIVCKEELDQEELRSYLLEILPNYMLPSYFVELEKIPLTSNGKVDKKSLPDPEVKSGDDYVAPRNDIEKLLVGVWSKVLGIESIGITDNFFSLGGDSIKTIQIQSRMNKAGFKISVRDIFVNPTISELSQKVTLKKSEVTQGTVRSNIQMTPIQHEFFRDKVDMNHYNQSVMLYSKERLDEEKIKAIFQKLQDHHDALRIICKYTNGEYSLYNEGIENFNVSLNIYDLENENDASEKIMDYANQIQRSIDLENGPLMKLGLFHLADGDRLLIVIHHLIVDGVSWRIIFEDIETLYKQAIRGRELTLPFKSNSFKDWSDKLTAYSKSNRLLDEKLFWENITNQVVLTLNREIDDVRYDNNERGSMQIVLDEITTSQLLTKTNEAYGTEINDILLCGLGYSIKNIIGNERVLISLEGHGREDIFPDIDISRTIGWFTTVYPVLLDMKFSDNLSMQIKSVKESLHQIPEKGIGYGVLKYLTSIALKEGLQFNDKAQIEFNYLGQFDSDVDQMSHFSIANESWGEESSSKRELNYDFSFIGMITKSKLSISVSYRKKYYSEKLISALLDSYKKSLVSIINHCKNSISLKDGELINDIFIDEEIKDYSDEIII